MKNLKIQFSTLLLLSLFFAISCTDAGDGEPKSISPELLVKTWAIKENSIRLGGIPISNIYDIATVPANLRPNWNQVRLVFNVDGTFNVQNVNLLGIPPSGTWVISGVNNNEITINPGNVVMEISNLSSSKFDVEYTINTAGTDFENLGATVVVSAEMEAVD